MENTEVEIYSIDYDPNTDTVLCGCSDDSYTTFTSDLEILGFKNFSDSVVFVKFIQDFFIVVTFDGEIHKIKNGEKIGSFESGGETIKFIPKQDYFYHCVGNLIYRIKYDLEIENVYAGHKTNILDFDVGDAVYSVSNDGFLVHNCDSSIRYKFSGFGYHSVFFCDLLVLQLDKNLVIFREGTKLQEMYLPGIEAVLKIDKIIVVGGDFEYFLMIDTANGFSLQKINFLEKVGGVLKIVNFGFDVVFSTGDGLIGFGSLRDGRFLFKESGVGVVFDFCVSGNLIFLGGEMGVAVLENENKFEF